MSKGNIWCDRCKEDCFPIATPENERGRPGFSKFKMGLLYPKSKVPKRFRERLFSGGTSIYACGELPLTKVVGLPASTTGLFPAFQTESSSSPAEVSMIHRRIFPTHHRYTNYGVHTTYLKFSAIHPTAEACGLPCHFSCNCIVDMMNEEDE